MLRYAAFTGTQDGMSGIQLKNLEALLDRLNLASFHHGCCIGADEEAHEIAYALEIPIYGYPCDITAKVAQIPREQFHWYGEHKAPLDRNKDIITASDFLIACPKTHTEELRSGTWATIRHARKMQIPVIILV